MIDPILLSTSDAAVEQARRYAGRCERLAAALRANREAVFDALAAAALTLVVVGFDGAGDSGQIEAMDAYIDEALASLPEVEVRLAPVPWDADDIEFKSTSLADALEAVAYGLLQVEHSGWEINEGAFGEFTFDVPKRSIRLDFNQRIETSELSVFEW